MKEGNATNDSSLTTSENITVSDDELYDYFSALIDAYKSDDDEVTQNTLFEVVKNTPRYSLTHSLTHLLTHSLTHSKDQIIQEGDYCNHLWIPQAK